MRGSAVALMALIAFSSGWSEPPPRFHLSINFGLYDVRDYMGDNIFGGGLSLGYSGGKDASIRLRADYISAKDFFVMGLKLGARNYVFVDVPAGPFIEAGVGSYSVYGDVGDLNLGSSFMVLYADLGFRYGVKYFIEGSAGFNMVYAIFPVLKYELSAGVSF